MSTKAPLNYADIPNVGPRAKFSAIWPIVQLNYFLIESETWVSTLGTFGLSNTDDHLQQVVKACVNAD
jgi:hypothetical protein